MTIAPLDNDVLIPLSKNNDGTVNFRKKIDDIYNTNSIMKEKKHELSKLMVLYRYEKCRFLERNADDDNWYEINDEKVLLKIYEYYLTIVFDGPLAQTQRDHNQQQDKHHNQNKRHKTNGDALNATNDSGNRSIVSTNPAVPQIVDSDDDSSSDNVVDGIEASTSTSTDTNTLIDQYIDTDVVFARGVFTAGTVLYRTLIQQKIQLYKTANNDTKRSIAISIVDTIMIHGKRRFVECKTSENGTDKYWRILSTKEAIDKAMHTFRDKVRKDRIKASKNRTNEIDINEGMQYEQDDNSSHNKNSSVKRKSIPIYQSQSNTTIQNMEYSGNVTNIDRLSLLAYASNNAAQESIQPTTNNVGGKDGALL
jgi:hypothetical protein